MTTLLGPSGPQAHLALYHSSLHTGVKYHTIRLTFINTPIPRSHASQRLQSPLSIACCGNTRRADEEERPTACVHRKKQMDTLDLVRQLKQPPSSGCSLSLGLRPKGGLCCTVLVQAGKALEFWPLLILTREPTAGILGLFWASQA